MAMDDQEIINIVKSHCFSKSEVMLSADLVSELKIDGDDADELFEDLLKHNPIELPIERLSKCFHSEGELLDFLYFPKLLFYKLGLRSKPPLRELELFTVNDLVKLFKAKTI